jgi:hypothetical protein
MIAKNVQFEVKKAAICFENKREVFRMALKRWIFREVIVKYYSGN